MKAPASLLPLTLDRVCFEAGGRRIIDTISLAIEAGPRTVILGPNGAGKSVLLRLCHGLLAPTSGRDRLERAGARERRAPAGDGLPAAGAAAPLRARQRGVRPEDRRRRARRSAMHAHGPRSSASG